MITIYGLCSVKEAGQGSIPHNGLLVHLRSLRCFGTEKGGSSWLWEHGAVRTRSNLPDSPYRHVAEVGLAG